MSTTLAGPGAAPDLIAPVTGYRQWRIRDGRLHSLLRDDAWPQATLTARCQAQTHPDDAAPKRDCSCGVYAWYRPCPRTASTASAELVAGAVVLWGHVELHAIGMRGQHCRLVALALPLSRGRKRDRVVAVADQLGCPAVPHRALCEVAAMHGSPVPAQLIPPRQSAVPHQPVGLVPRMVLSATGAASGRSTPTSRRKT